MTANKIWEHDDEKKKALKSARNIDLIVVWESDPIDESINMLRRKIDELGQDKNQKQEINRSTTST